MKIYKKNIPSAGPSITDLEIKLVTEAVKDGWYENRNKHIDQFTKEFSDYIGIKYCFPVVNCTSAIHLALLSLGIGPGDEVIIPDITWVASAEPVVYVGATPVFADIDRRSWCLSTESFRKLITKRTKAVVVVDLYGNMPAMDEIMRIAKVNHIHIIEDAAEAIGSEYKGKKAGTFGDIGVFSFNATKLVMAGQGVMLITNKKDIYEKAKKFAHHGMLKYTSNTTFWSKEIGFNYQWTNIQAALALAQFRRLNELLEMKKKTFGWYKDELSGTKGINLNSECFDIKNTFWVAVAIIDPKYYQIRKENLLRHFKLCNIDPRPFFYPISSMPAFSKYTKDKNMKKINPISYEISPYGICLPSSMSITVQEVKYVCDSLKKILKAKNI